MRKINNIFLATTALEESWDTSKHMLFLGKWCFDPQSKIFGELLSGEVISNPMDDPEMFYEANKYIARIYESFLDKLVPILNTIHSEKHNERYWRILIGPWLYFYINAIYKRYVVIKAAVKKYPVFETIALSDESFVVPLNMLDYMLKIEQDRYNLQIFTKVLQFLGYDFFQKKIKFFLMTANDHSNGSNPGRILKRIYNDYCKKIYIFFQNEQSIIVKNTFFATSLEYRLMIKSLFKIWVDKTDEYKQLQAKPNRHMRTQLQEMCVKDNEFEGLLAHILPDDCPQCFLESYEIIKNISMKAYPVSPKVIFSATSNYFDEVFKQWAARNTELGTILIGAQHGGYYGYYQDHFYTEHEIKINDKYYSWGWDSKRSGEDSVVPFVATKLGGYKKFAADNKKNRILYTTISQSRYRFFLNVFSVSQEVPEWRSLFIKTLLPEMHKKLNIRVREGVHDLFETMFPDYQIESWKTSSFLKSLEKCRICICDYCGTTFLESLSLNKPTIVFFNPETNRLCKTEEPYFEQLRKVGILYYRPEDAAQAVNAIYGDVEGWWNRPHLQSVRLQFCERFARTSSDPIGDWSKELLNYA